MSRGLSTTRQPRAGAPSSTYAPAPESRAVARLQPSYGLFIDGAFRDPIDGDAFKTISPSSEEVLAEVTLAGPRDVDAAVAAARAAFEGPWGTMPGRAAREVPVPDRAAHPGARP